MRRLNIGVIGPGWWLRDYLLQPLRAVPGVDVRAVVAGTLASAERAAHELAIPASYADVAAMLEREDLDAVVLTAPPSAHADAVRQAAAHGLAIFCEKPLAPTADAAAEMVSLTSGLATAVGFSQRWNPALRELRRRLIGGAIGTLERVHYDFLNARALGDPARKSWEYRPEEYPLGILSDLGTHAVDTASWLCGPLNAALRCEVIAQGTGRETWDDVRASLRTADGACISLHVSRVSVPWPEPWYRQRVEVHGSRGSLVFDSARPMLIAHEQRGQVREISVQGLPRSDSAAAAAAGELARRAQAVDVAATLRGEVVSGVPDFGTAHRGQVWLERLAELAAVAERD